MSHLFGDHMVLQADVIVPVWGQGAPGERITLRIDGREESADTDANGRWEIRLPPMKAGGPFTMKVSSPSTEFAFSDVLVGEVWLGAGQSNMARTVPFAKDAEKEIASAANDQIRVFMVKEVTSPTPVLDVEGEWKVCSPESVSGFSAVGYFFARDLQPAIKRPVGVIVAAIGASAAESFVRRESLEAVPKLQYIVKAADERAKLVEQARLEFETAHAAWEQKIRDSGRADSLAKPRTAAEAKSLGEPRPTSILNDFQWASTISNGMIQPLAPYSIRGVLWYQGEHNAKRAEEYRTLLPTLIEDWRSLWKNPSLPFLIVQLPNFSKPTTMPAESAWAELREAQARTATSVLDVLLAVTIDLGEVDIHPRDKQGVGQRLASLALKHVYQQQEVIADAPRFVRAARDGHRMRLDFDTEHLTSDGEEICGFTIAGPDRKFFNAKATLENGSIVVWADEVPEPVAIRYAWADNPRCNLRGPGGLPMMPFRTDDWAGVTAGATKRVEP